MSQRQGQLVRMQRRAAPVDGFPSSREAVFRVLWVAVSYARNSWNITMRLLRGRIPIAMGAERRVTQNVTCAAEDAVVSCSPWVG